MSHQPQDGDDPEHLAAREAFDAIADGNEVIPLDQLPAILTAICHPEELEDAMSVVAYQKRYYFDCAPQGLLSWNELERWLTSARPTME